MVQDRAWRDGWTIRDQLEIMTQSRTAIAELIGAQASEIAITQSASYSINLIANGLAWRAGDNIVLTELAYRSVAMSMLRVASEREVELRVVGAPELLLQPDSFRGVVDARTRLVVVPLQPMFCGVPQPAADISRVVRERSEALICVNATQAVGQHGVQVSQLDCDFLFGTARKWLRGPRGVGFLYVREALIPALRPTFIGYPAARWTDPDAYDLAAGIDRLHLGDYPYPSLVELTAAVRYAMNLGLDCIEARNRHLGRVAREILADVPGLTIYDRRHGVMGTVPINVRGLAAEAVAVELERRGVTACVAYEENALWSLPKLGCAALVRLSLHYFNTEDEIARVATALREIAGAR